MKTEKELNELKNELEALNKKLATLTEDELRWVTGGNLDKIAHEVDNGDSAL